MDVRILDLDGSLLRQEQLLRRCTPAVCPLNSWGPRVRLGCSFRRFRHFEQALGAIVGSPVDEAPPVTFVGSGDFHHVSLALVRRQTSPFNLLVLDNHPDWMRGIPFLHCGTWVYHAARSPLVHRIFHVGGDVDFDNSWRWLAPWPLLGNGQITTIPGRRTFRRGPWARIDNRPVRGHDQVPAGRETLEELLRPFRADLACRPLYVSIDKDVLGAHEAAVNWDSGHLTLEEIGAILEAFFRGAQGLAGIDVVGDWSPVSVRGLFRKVLHLTEHPPLSVDAAAATALNERTNLRLLDLIRAAVHDGHGSRASRAAG